MNRRIIEDMLRAIDLGDWQALEALMHPDTRYEVSGFPPYEGRRAVLDYYENVRPIATGHHEIEQVIADGDDAVCCGRFTGTRRDGVKVDVLFADLVRIEHGLIRSRRVYYCQPTD